MIERVFRSNDKQDNSIKVVDLDALEKEISIDIAELRRDLRSWKNDLYEHLSLSAKKISEEDPENAEEKGSPVYHLSVDVTFSRPSAKVGCHFERGRLTTPW